MEDTRIVYGAQCTWWDSIDKVGTRPVMGLRLAGQTPTIPCCPRCKGTLYQLPNIESWQEQVDTFDATKQPGYRAMMAWARGRCFPSYDFLCAAYAGRTGP